MFFVDIIGTTSRGLCYANSVNEAYKSRKNWKNRTIIAACSVLALEAARSTSIIDFIHEAPRTHIAPSYQTGQCTAELQWSNHFQFWYRPSPCIWRTFRAWPPTIAPTHEISAKFDNARFELLRFDKIFLPVFRSYLYCHFSAMSGPNCTNYGQDISPNRPIIGALWICFRITCDRLLLFETRATRRALGSLEWKIDSNFGHFHPC